MNVNENRRVKITKKMLKDALLEMLQTDNIQKISVRELCAKADINRSTFYQHYGSPYELLSEIENDFLNTINAEIEKENSDAIGQNHIESVLYFIKEHLTVSRILINENAAADFRQKLIGLPAIMERFEQELKRYDETEQIYVRKFILFGGYNAIVHWINTGCHESPKQIKDIIMGIILKILE